MPKPIISQREKQAAESVCKVKKCNVSNSFSKTKLDKLLRKQRSKGYVDMICELDAGGHVTNQDKVKQIIQKIKDEFPEIDISPILLGIVSTCYLEKPYEVHTLDIEGGVLEHYKKGQVLPKGMERVRGIAMNGGYAFIEVYTDCYRAVLKNGMVAVVPY